MSDEEKGKKVKALMVDDSEDLLELVKTFFERDRPMIDLEVTSSGEDALEMVEEGAYDVIVSDYDMPVMDGLEFLEKIRSDGIDTPFIILTGKGQEEVAMEALNKGADKYHKKSKNVASGFDDLADSMLEEAKRAKSEDELKTFQHWIKGSVDSDEDEDELF